MFIVVLGVFELKFFIIFICYFTLYQKAIHFVIAALANSFVLALSSLFFLSTPIAEWFVWKKPSFDQ